MKKGPLFEKQVVEYLQAHGFPYAERRVMGGSNDRGDVGGIPGVVLELKNQKRLSLAEWVDEAELEANNAGVDVFAVVHKRRGIGNPAEAYCTLPLRVLAGLLEPRVVATARSVGPYGEERG